MNPYGIVYALIALIVWIIGYLVLVFILKKLVKQLLHARKYVVFYKRLRSDRWEFGARATSTHYVTGRPQWNTTKPETYCTS